MKKLTTLIIILVIISISGYLFYKEGTLPVQKKDKSTKIFIIRKGESLNLITNNLADEKLIRSKIIFFIIVKRLGIEKKIQAGDFRLSPSMDAYEIAQNLTHGTLDIWVTIQEGLRKEEVAQIIVQSINIPEIEFVKKAEEGYLFPDTYLIPKNADYKMIISLLSNTFQKKFTVEMKEKAKKLGLSVNEAITLASLVEREAKFDPDRQEVANILLRRLKEDMPLQIDATLQYIAGYQIAEKSWWKKSLTEADKEIDSTYNTYKYTGIPPDPICNPGLKALESIINGDSSTPYLYYVNDKNNKLHFAKTLEEHEVNINKYLP